jgi:S-layer homology domain
MKKLLILLMLVSVPFAAFAIVSDYNIDPLDNVGTAKTTGLGGAFTAVDDDINSIFFNPAGFANSDGIIMSGRDMNNFSLGLSYPAWSGNVGLGISYKSFDNFDLTGFTATYGKSMAFIGYGYAWGPVDFGLNVKTLLSQRLSIKGSADLTSATGFDGDLGLIWHALPYLSVGAVIHNAFGGLYTIGSSSETFPRTITAGLALDLLGGNAYFTYDPFTMKAYADASSITFDNGSKSSSNVGLEIGWQGWLYVRLGSSYLNNISTVDAQTAIPSFGIGIRSGDTSFDLASTKDLVNGGTISYFSYSYSPPNFSPFSRTAAQTVKGPTKDLLALSSPEDEFTAYEDTVVVSGETRRGAEVLINGVNAYVDDAGRFNAIQPLMAGKNLIEIEGRDKYGSKTITRRVLKKARIKIAEESTIDQQIQNEITEKEQKLAERQARVDKDRENGKDVTARQAMLDQDRQILDARKAELLAQKKDLVDRADKVDNLVTLGVIEVAPDKNFEIEAPIKRGEMIAWLVKGAGLVTVKPATTPFVDVPQDSQYAPAVKAAYEGGYIKLGDDRKFRPNDPVTEDEAQEFLKDFGVIK